MLSPEARRARARIGALTRHHPDRPEAAEADRRELKAASAERYVRRLRAEWPPLTAQQRAELAALLLAEDGAA